MTKITNKPKPRLILAMLLLVYIFNFLDRQLLGILAGPIKAELALSDTQFGAIGGLAFALLYATLGVPLGYLADRTSRTWVITTSLVVWSVFTGLCGVVTGYWQLFAARLGVGTGEAGGVAPSYALLAEYFPSRQLGRVYGIFSLGVPIGLSFGTIFGAYIAAMFNWRAAFLVMGAAGLLLAPIFRLLVRDNSPPVKPQNAGIGIFPGLRAVTKIPAFWLMSVAASFSSLCGYGLALWMPSVLMRSFHLPLLDTAHFIGSALLLGGAVGVVGGGWLADRLGRKDRGWYIKVPAVAWLVTAPCYAAGLFAPTPAIAWCILVIPQALQLMWMGPITAAVQHLVPPNMRATASASFLFINNLVGLGVGPLLMGVLSDQLHDLFGQDALRNAVVICLSFYLLAALLAVLAVKSLRQSWIEDPQE